MIKKHLTLETISVPIAGKHLGLGRNSAYQAAKRGDIPTVRIGRLIRVPILALEEMLRESVKRTAIK